jgi:hypothetical protein
MIWQRIAGDVWVLRDQEGGPILVEAARREDGDLDYLDHVTGKREVVASRPSVWDLILSGVLSRSQRV